MIKRKTQWTDRAQRRVGRAMIEAEKLAIMEASFRRQREEARRAREAAGLPVDADGKTAAATAPK